MYTDRFDNVGLFDGSVSNFIFRFRYVLTECSWWQEGIESQAIDRCNRFVMRRPLLINFADNKLRIGQKKPVHVYQLVAENTVESKVLDIQERKKKMIQEAFSGIKSNETQRQKKEARLQGIIHNSLTRGLNLTDCRFD
jgi:hypothetical protein